MAYKPNDHYAKKARQQKFAARSVFKLQEIDQKWALFRHDQSVLELGCAPGSWAQYISTRIGKRGTLLGIDLKPPEVNPPNTILVEADIYETDFEALASEHNVRVPFDVIASDMMTNTTGHRATDQAKSAGLCEMALEVAKQHLAPGGNFVVKMFEGPDTQPFRKELQRLFGKSGTVRPKSTRKTSKEIFLVAKGFHGGTKI